MITSDQFIFLTDFLDYPQELAVSSLPTAFLHIVFDTRSPFQSWYGI